MPKPVKKKKTLFGEVLSLLQYCQKTKRKTAKTYNPVSPVLRKKVKEGPDYICSVWCLVNYTFIGKNLFFPCVSQSTRCLLLLAQT